MKDAVVLYPSPGIGHVISMVELGKLILQTANHDLSVTILLISSEWDHPGTDSYIKATSQANPLISFRRLPFVAVDPAPPRSRAAMLFGCIRLNAPHVRDCLKEMAETSSVRALVIDFFCASALQVGVELRIPTCFYFASGAAALAAFLCLPRIHEEQSKSFKDLQGTVLHFPCVPPLKAVHAPEPVLDRDDPAYSGFMYFCSHLPKAQGIVVNSFVDLEPKAVKVLEDGVCLGSQARTPPVYCIGPLIAPGGGHEHDCLSWLEKQPEGSVVFLCFGSRGSFSRQQVAEIAEGMERSGRRFLWVVKNLPSKEESKQTEDLSDFELECVLPEGFLERVQDRAMVVKTWAPQVPVLNHGAVGGFVTHCGWNSVLEAVVAGVPMIAWPLYAEQHLNRNVLVEDMCMAIPVEQGEADGFVTGDELEKRVRELMDSDKGRELREKSRNMKVKGLAAWSEDGSSARALANLVETWQTGERFAEQEDSHLPNN